MCDFCVRAVCCACVRESYKNAAHLELRLLRRGHVGITRGLPAMLLLLLLVLGDRGVGSGRGVLERRVIELAFHAESALACERAREKSGANIQQQQQQLDNSTCA